MRAGTKAGQLTTTLCSRRSWAVAAADLNAEGMGGGIIQVYAGLNFSLADQASLYADGATPEYMMTDIATPLWSPVNELGSRTQPAGCGGGSGGTIVVRADMLLAAGPSSSSLPLWSGVISACGGAGSRPGGGGGGGGLVSLRSHW